MQVEVIERQGFRVHDLAIVDEAGEVWLTFARPWWCVLDWIWWWLTILTRPTSRVLIRPPEGPARRVQVRAVRFAPKLLRLAAA